MRADTKIWNDSGTDWWNNPASNWTGGLPGSGDDAVIGLGGTAYFLNGSNSIRSLYVGDSIGGPIGGAGTVRWDDNSSLFTSGTSFIGNTGSVGTVQARHSQWVSSADIIIGSSGTGLLDIAGGRVSNTFSFIGADTGITGTVNVTGAGSTWTQSAGVVVGHNGIGNLTISGGGVATNKEAIIGRYRTLNEESGNEIDTAQGTVVVTGAGSIWSNSDYVVVGAEGKGTLTIQDGGLVRVGWNGTAATGTLTLGQGGSSNNELNIGAGGSAGTLLAATVTGGAGTGTKTVNFNHTGSHTFAPNLTGSLKVQAIGTGTTLLTGTNTHTGGTFINWKSTLQIGNGGTTGTISGMITGSGTLAFNRSDNTSFALAFSGGESPSIAQNGAGTITLTNPMTDFKSWLVPASGSTLVLSNAYTSPYPLLKSGDGFLRLTANISHSDVRIDGGILQVGNGATGGSLTSSRILLNSGVIAFDRSDDVVFATPLSGQGGVRKLNSNKLTLTNTAYSGLTDISAGTLVLQSGILTGATAGAGKLVKTTTGDLSIGYISNDLGHTGGTEVQAGKLAFNSEGAIAGNIAVSSGATFDFSRSTTGDYNFGGSFSGAGTVSVSAGLARVLPVAALSGFTGTFAINNSSSSFAFDTATAGSFSNAVTGTGVFGKRGAGTLTYTGAAVNTGGFSVTGGRLNLGNGGTTGTYLTDVASTATISSGATLAFDRSDSFAFAGRLTGQGTFTKAGAGTLTLTNGLDSFTGALAIEGGTLALNTNDNTTLKGAITGTGKFIKQGGGTFFLKSDAARNDALANTVSLTIAGGTFSLGVKGNNTYSGSIDGAGAFRYDPNDAIYTLTYTGTATHTGGTAVGNGTLSIGNGGTTGSISGDIAFNSRKLVINRSDAVTLPNKLTSNTGTLANAGSGNATFTGDLSGLSGNTFDVTGTGALILGSAYSSLNTIVKTGSGKLTLGGETTTYVQLNAGTLQIGNGGTTGTLTGNIFSVGAANTVRFDRSDDFTYGGRIDGSGILLVKAGSNNLTLTDNISAISTIIAGGNLILGNANNWGIGTISGAGALHKNGAGSVVIAGATHTGGTFVNAGTLHIGGDLSGTTTVASGATLSFFAQSSLVSDVTGGGNLTIQSSANVFAGVATHTGATTITGLGSLAVGDARNFTFGSTTDGTGTLKKTGSGTMTATGAFGHATTTVAAGTLITGSLGTGTTTVDSGATLRINPSADTTFAGAVANSGTFNKAGESTLTFSDSFSQTSGGVTMISGGTLALTYSTGDSSLAGTLQGAGAFEKRGAGTLNLTGTSGHTGGTFVTGGTLLLSTDAFLTGNVSVASGATFGITKNHYTFGGAISGAGGFKSQNNATLTGALTYTGNTHIGGNGILTLNTSVDTTLSGSLTGDGSLLKTGSSTLTLSGDGSAFTRVIEVNAGTLRLASADNVRGPVWLAGGSLTTDATARTFTGQLTVYTSALIGGNGGDLILSGNLESRSGATLTKFGTNTVILTAANSFTEHTIINGGTLRLYGIGRLNEGTGHDLTVNTGGTFDVGANPNVSRQLILDGGTLTGTVGIIGVSYHMMLRSGVVDAILDAGPSITLEKTTAGTVTLSRANTYEGKTQINGGLINFASMDNFGPTGTVNLDGGGLQWATGNTLDITSSSRFNRAYGDAGAIFDTNGNNVTFAHAPTGAGTFTKAGAGTLTLSASTLHQGNTVITGGTLEFAASGDRVYAGAISGAGALTKSGGGRVTLSANNTYTGATTISAGTLVLKGAGASSSHAIASGAMLELNVDSGNRDLSSTTYSGGGTLVKSGGGTATWGAGSATFAMTAGSFIDVQTGTLVGGSNANENWTANRASLHVASGASFYGIEANVTVDALTGGGAIYSGLNGAGYERFTFGKAGGSGTFSGVLSNFSTFAGNYEKTGAGIQILTGTNTYTGATTVSEGTLVVNGSLANTTVTVADGATLGGSGVINGHTTLETGATLAAGNSPGTLTFTNGLAFDSGALLKFELGTISDKIVVSGGILSANGTITVNISDSGGFTAGTYTLIDATGATLTSIGATSLGLGTTIAGYDFAFIQNGALFQLTAVASAVPEPAASAILAGLGALALASLRRRRV
ncbi:MAG: autotransporter-associated beta strand repeat-containing protein [Rariglobus sp.]